LSYECIYKFIWKSKNSYKKENRILKNSYKKLKHNEKLHKKANYRHTRELISNRVVIKERSSTIEKKVSANPRLI